jgi:hypothetical protein
MRYLESLERANLSSLQMFGEPVELNGEIITAAVDDLSQTSFARSGGRVTDTESAIFVDEAEFIEAGGKKGSIIKFLRGPLAGKISMVQKISDFQGVLYLALAPFRP